MNHGSIRMPQNKLGTHSDTEGVSAYDAYLCAFPSRGVKLVSYRALSEMVFAVHLQLSNKKDAPEITGDSILQGWVDGALWRPQGCDRLTPVDVKRTVWTRWGVRRFEEVSRLIGPRKLRAFHGHVTIFQLLN